MSTGEVFTGTISYRATRIPWQIDYCLGIPVTYWRTLPTGERLFVRRAKQMKIRMQFGQAVQVNGEQWVIQRGTGPILPELGWYKSVEEAIAAAEELADDDV